MLSGREAVWAFEALGWQVARQSSSHIILVKPGHRATLSVPDHRQVAKGTLRSLIRQAGLILRVGLVLDACHATRLGLAFAVLAEEDGVVLLESGNADV